VPDLKPPRLEGGELETVRALLQYQRESFVRKVTGIGEEAARRAPVGSGTNLLWLTKHMTRAESLWILRRFAGLDTEIPDDDVLSEDTLQTAIGVYRGNWPRIDAVVVTSPSLDAPCREVGEEAPVNLRWVLLHLLEETARHAGHADVLREMIDGETGR
jgi:hypothetical protein